jgi:MFS family permease
MSARPTRLVPTLPKQAWQLIAGMGVGCMGTGFAYSFLVIYLHYERGLSLGLAGLCLSVVAVGGLAAAPLVGVCADRFGPRTVLIIALLVSAAGCLGLAFVSRPWEALCVALVFGIGSVSIDAPEMSLLAIVVRREQRSAAFAVSYAAFSAGLSAGAVIGGWFVDLEHPVTFQASFVIAALPYVAYAVVVWRFVRPARCAEGDIDAPALGDSQTKDPQPVPTLATTPACPVAAASAPAPVEGHAATWLAGYAPVLHDRAFLLLITFNFAIFAISFSQLNAAYPAYAVGAGHISTRWVGLGLGANAIAIVAAQLIVLRLLTGRKRTRALGIACLAAAACWFTVALAARAGGGLAIVGFVLAPAVLGLGETALSPSLYPMANDLAPDALRGRYNAVMFMTESAGRIVGPLLAGFLLAAGAGDALVVGLAVAMVCTVSLTLVMERSVPASANIIGEADQEAEMVESAAAG